MYPTLRRVVRYDCGLHLHVDRDEAYRCLHAQWVHDLDRFKNKYRETFDILAYRCRIETGFAQKAIEQLEAIADGTPA